MKKIWAPWRSQFIYLRQPKGCIFCRAWKGKNDKKNLVLLRGNLSFVMLNIYPYNNGHLMAAPARHVSCLEKLKKDELLELMDLTNKSTRLLKKILKPEGFNLGVNMGKISGAGFPGHVHIHIVPRWNGDTNFMPVLTQTKIISESLESLYSRLKRHVKNK